MTVDEVKMELEKIVSNLTSSGFGKIDSNVVERLEKLIVVAEELNMNEGKRLIENLVSAMKSDTGKESKIKSCNVRLMALDFYLKKLSQGANTEDQ